MLAKGTFDQPFIDAARARVNAVLDATEAAAAAGVPEAPLASAALLTLEAHFVHRGRGQEGKDGNALNESRLLARSIIENDGVLVADKTIRWKPEHTVLGYAVGDTITLSAADVRTLADAFYVEIAAKFT